EVSKLSTDEREALTERNRRIGERAYELTADPTKTLVAPKTELVPDALSFSAVQSALERLQQSAKNYDAALKEASTAQRLQSRENQRELDLALQQIELMLVLDQGLPRRPWYKHAIYAPGFYTGYGAKTLPGIREAIEQHKWSEAAEQIGIVAGVLERAAAQIDRATAIVKSN